MLPSIVTSFLLRVLASLTVRSLPAWRPQLNFRLRRLSRYRKELEKTVRAMPFIYQGLEGEVLSDYVDIEMSSLELASLQLKPISRLRRDSTDQLRNNRRILFLGQAGAGKTTFQRYVILSLLRGSDTRFVYPAERIVPVYIPLKAIDNSSPFPIVRYMLQNNLLFAGKDPAARLIKLSLQKRLFFFLDGYDEIPFAGSRRSANSSEDRISPSSQRQNFVQDELGAILGTGGFPRSPKGTLGEALQAMSYCRVWLSSRREFFETNPVGGIGSGIYPLVDPGLTAIELRGVGGNRTALARIIFTKYSRRSFGYSDLLSEEYFVNTIDGSSDEDIRRLSFNPLFLTIMCYIYAQRAIEEGAYAIDWSDRFDNLVLECIRLLLKDLDEYKARDLPPAHKAGLLNRRNSFLEEKQDFLEFFAAQLFFEAQAVFDLEYLKKLVRQFFLTVAAPRTDRLILRDLDNDVSDRPNFALQLIFSGVFVTVDRVAGRILYDFPHRRFREVLASKHIATPERYLELLARLEEGQFAEFVRVFRASRWFNDFAFQNAAAIFIFAAAIRGSRARDWRAITDGFLSLKPAEFEPNHQAQQMIRDALAVECPNFQVTVAILDYVALSDELVEKVEASFAEGIASVDPDRIQLCCEILLRFNKPLLREWLRREAVNSQGAVAVAIIQGICLLDLRIMLPYAQSLNQNCLGFHYGFYLAAYWSRICEPSDIELGDTVREIFSFFTRRSLISAFYGIAKYFPQAYEDLKARSGFDIAGDLFELLINLKELRWELALPGDDCFSFSERNVGSLRDFISQLSFPVLLKKERLSGDGRKKMVLYADVSGQFSSELDRTLSRLSGRIISDHRMIQSEVGSAFGSVLRGARFLEPAALRTSGGIRSSIDEAELVRSLGKRISDITKRTAATTRMNSASIREIYGEIEGMPSVPRRVDLFFA